MTRHNISFLVLACAATLLLGLAGCTQNSTTAVSSPNLPAQQFAAGYFPVAPGMTETFSITTYGGATSQMTLKVGPRVPFKSDSAWLWFAIHSDNSVDTDFVVVTSSAVELYEDANASPETIIRTPVIVGQSWTRFPVDPTLEIDSVGDTITLGTEYGGGIVTKGNGGGDGGGGGGIGKVIPIDGSENVRVDGIEEVVLSSGAHYAKAVRMRTDNAQGTANYYWYAPGYGIVKYVLGATSPTSAGSQTGELVN